jgi:alcohol dehydrogenase class IV
LRQRSLTKVLIVTDPGIVAAGIIERVIAILSQRDIRHVIFDEVTGSEVVCRYERL